MATGVSAGNLTWDIRLTSGSFKSAITASMTSMRAMAATASAVGTSISRNLSRAFLTAGRSAMRAAVVIGVGLTRALPTAGGAALSAARFIGGALVNALRGAISWATRWIAIGGAILSGAIIYGLKRSIDLAADAEESLGRMSFAFGESAGHVIAMAKSLAQSLGRSNYEIIELVANAGMFFRGMGIGEEQAGVMSNVLTRMAANLAEVANIDIGEAMDALSGALRGRALALRQYGIDLDDAAIAEEMLLMGLKATTAEGEQRNKVLATMSLLTKRMAKFNGEAAGSVADFDGQLLKLKGAIRDIGTDIGRHLLPPLREFLKFINDRVIPKVRELVDSFFKGDGIQKVGRWVAKVISSVERFFWAMFNIGRAMVQMLAAAGKAIAKFFGLDLAEGLGGDALEQIIEMVGRLSDVVAGLAQSWEAVFKYLFDSIRLFVTSLGEDIGHFIGTKILAPLWHIWDEIARLFGLIKDTFVKMVDFVKAYWLAKMDPTNFMAQFDLLKKSFDMNAAIDKMFKFTPRKMADPPPRTKSKREQELEKSIGDAKEIITRAVNTWRKFGDINAEAWKQFFKKMLGVEDEVKKPKAGATELPDAGETSIGKASFTAMSDGWRKIQEQINMQSKDAKRDTAIHSTARSAKQTVDLLREMKEISRGTKDNIGWLADSLLRDNPHTFMVGP